MLDKDISVLGHRIQGLEEDVRSHDKYLFGEYGGNGINSRLKALEERVNLFWKVLGVIGTVALGALSKTIWNTLSR
jgi:hypothetical protein